MQRSQFTFYRSFYEAVRHLPEEDREKILMAILRYALDSEESQNLQPVQAAIFALVKPVLDAGAQKAVSGKRGGKAKRKQNASKREKEEEVEGEIEKENKIENEDKCLFAAFWAAYPRKTDKQKAFALWKQLRPDAKAVMDGLQAWKKSGQWLQEGGRFVPGPVRWLQEQMWTFPPKPAVPQGASGVLGEAELEALRKLMEED